MTRSVLLPALGLTTIGTALAQAPPAPDLGVTVEGTNVNGIVFTWDVTNHTDKAINYFAIPVYYINTFDAPTDWQIVNEPRLRQGDFILQTDKYSAMILPNRTLQFKCMRPLRDVPQDGRVSATIGFEDGSRIEIPHVLGPVKRSIMENLLLPIFLGVLLIAAILVKTLKGKKAAGSAPAPP